MTQKRLQSLPHWPQASAHPLAKALAKDADAARLNISEDIARFRATASTGQLNGKTVSLGRASWLGADDVTQTATYLKIGDSTRCCLHFH